MTPGLSTTLSGLADSFRGVAEAAVARLHADRPTAKDHAVFMQVLMMASRMRADMDKAAAGDALSKAGGPFAEMASDLVKAAADWADLEKMLLAVAAEPQPRANEPWRGTPHHLIGRAITASTPTWGSA